MDRLALRDRPLGPVRAQPVAVLFADIVGFTGLSERESPERVIGLLREFHSRLEHAVFECGGTLDKYLGDGLMATFGTPDPGPRDAANALVCARSMLDAVANLNGDRAQAGEPPLRLSVGIHYGEVVLGDVGSERRLEFAVLGDVVNVANRLERLTRELGCRVVVSGELVQALRVQAGEQADALLAGFLHRELSPSEAGASPWPWRCSHEQAPPGATWRVASRHSLDESSSQPCQHSFTGRTG